MDTGDLYERWNAAKLAEYLLTYMQGKARLKGPRSIFFESLLRNEKAAQQMEGPNHYLRHALATLRTLDAPDKMERALALIGSNTLQLEEAVRSSSMSVGEKASFENLVSTFPGFDVMWRGTLSPATARDIKLKNGSKILLPAPTVFTAVEMDCLHELHEMAQESCIVALVYLHGAIEMGVSHIAAPEGMCVTLIRASPTGCEALGGDLDEVRTLEKSIESSLPPSLLLPGEDATEHESGTRRVSEAIYTMQEHLLFDLDHPFEKKRAMERYIRALQNWKGPGNHCTAVKCIPDQLFFNKAYGRKVVGYDIVDKIKIMHIHSSVDVFALMLKCGFGASSARTGLAVISRKQIFLFFQAIGVNALTVIDHACSSVVLPGTRDEASPKSIREFINTNKGVLGGNAGSKNTSRGASKTSFL